VYICCTVTVSGVSNTNHLTHHSTRRYISTRISSRSLRTGYSKTLLCVAY
jgi:hypothetical protein